VSLFDPAPATSAADALSGSSPLPLWSGPGDPNAPRRLEPVPIEKVAECAFRAKPCKRCGKTKASKVHTPKKTATCAFQRQNGCAACGRAKGDPAHFGAPESFNVFAGRDPNVYRSLMDTWKAILVPLLEASDLPKGLAHVLVEGEVSFGDGRERDQGNARVLIEKALGDALVSAGYLSADTWAHYEFGGYERAEEAGVSAVRLMLFPTLNP
jgi:hypothetical protein